MEKNGVKRIEFGLEKMFSKSFSATPVNSIMKVNKYEHFVATTNKLIKYEQMNYTTSFDYPSCAAVYLPGYEAIVLVSPIASEFSVYFLSKMKEPVLNGVKLDQMGVHRIIFSPKSDTLITLGLGIKTWKISCMMADKRRSILDEVVKIELRSSFVPEYRESQLIPPSFDAQSEVLHIISSGCLKSFDLDGRRLNPPISYFSTEFTVFAISTFNQKQMSFDAGQGTCLWSKSGSLIQKFSFTNSTIFAIFFLAKEFCAVLDSSEFISILDLKTGQCFPSLRLSERPQRIFFELGPPMVLTLCNGVTSTFYRICVPWKVWIQSMSSPKIIQRSRKPHKAARISIFYTDTSIQFLSPATKEALTICQSSMTSIPVVFLYDRGFGGIQRDQLFVVYQNGCVSIFGTGNNPCEEGITLDLKATCIAIGKFHGENCVLIGTWNGNVLAYQYEKLRYIRRMLVHSSAILKLFCCNESVVVVFADRIVIISCNDSSVQSVCAQPIGNICKMIDATIFNGYENGGLQIQNLKSGKLFTVRDRENRPHRAEVTDVNKGSCFYVSTARDGSVCIWDEGFEMVMIMKFPLELFCCEVLNGWREILLGTEKGVMITDRISIFDEVDEEDELYDNYNRKHDDLASDFAIFEATKEEEKKRFLIGGVTKEENNDNDHQLLKNWHKRPEIESGEEKEKARKSENKTNDKAERDRVKISDTEKDSEIGQKPIADLSAPKQVEQSKKPIELNNNQKEKNEGNKEETDNQEAKRKEEEEERRKRLEEERKKALLAEMMKSLDDSIPLKIHAEKLDAPIEEKPTIETEQPKTETIAEEPIKSEVTIQPVDAQPDNNSSGDKSEREKPKSENNSGRKRPPKLPKKTNAQIHEVQEPASPTEKEVEEPINKSKSPRKKKRSSKSQSPKNRKGAKIRLLSPKRDLDAIEHYLNLPSTPTKEYLARPSTSRRESPPLTSPTKEINYIPTHLFDAKKKRSSTPIQSPQIVSAKHRNGKAFPNRFQSPKGKYIVSAQTVKREVVETTGNSFRIVSIQRPKTPPPVPPKPCASLIETPQIPVFYQRNIKCKHTKRDPTEILGKIPESQAETSNAKAENQSEFTFLSAPVESSKDGATEPLTINENESQRQISVTKEQGKFTFLSAPTEATKLNSSSDIIDNMPPEGECKRKVENYTDIPIPQSFPERLVQTEAASVTIGKPIRLKRIPQSEKVKRINKQDIDFENCGEIPGTVRVDWDWVRESADNKGVSISGRLERRILRDRISESKNGNHFILSKKGEPESDDIVVVNEIDKDIPLPLEDRPFIPSSIHPNVIDLSIKKPEIMWDLEFAKPTGVEAAAERTEQVKTARRNPSPPVVVNPSSIKQKLRNLRAIFRPILEKG